MKNPGEVGQADLPEAKSALENASTLLLSRVLMAVVAWAGTVLIVGQLTESDWGRFSFVFSLLALVAILTDLGVGRVALAEVLPGEAGRARSAGNYLMLRFVLGLFGYGVVAAVVVLGGYDDVVVRATLVGGLSLILATMIGAYTIAFQAAERAGHVALSSVVVQLGQLALIVALAVRGGSLMAFVWAMVARDAVLLPWRAWRSGQFMPVSWEFDWPTQKRMLVEALPVSVGVVMQSAYWRLDSVMLSKMTTFEDVGIYGVAYKFADLAHAAPLAMSAAILAPLVRSWPGEMDVFRRAFQRSGTVLLVLAGFTFVQMALFAEPLIGLFFADSYLAGVQTAQLLVLAEVGAFLAVLASTALIAAGRHWAFAAVALVGVVANVGLNLALIPSQGFEGAAIATVVTEVGVAGLALFIVSQLPEMGRFGSFGAPKVLAISVATFAFGWCLLTVGVPWPVCVVGVTLAFVGGALVSGYPALVRDFLQADS